VTTGAANLHGTAILIGRRGLLFVGPSGIGKSAMAFACMATARRQKAPSLLIADDQVLISARNGRILAACPQSIAGLIELRGSGIISMDHIEKAELDLVVQVVAPGDTERLPPENERFSIDGAGSLPLVRVANTAADPLAVIGGLIPGWREEVPFW
jgi:serine kinase of HPr protein (carbohydrate metabolism regulator)